MRSSLVAFAALIVLAAGPALAQSPVPHNGATPHPKKTPFMTFTHPSAGKTAGPVSGSECVSGRGANAAQNTVNPITGQKTTTIVAIPVGGGNVQSATTHAQQASACAHGH